MELSHPVSSVKEHDRPLKFSEFEFKMVDGHHFRIIEKSRYLSNLLSTDFNEM